MNRIYNPPLFKKTSHKASFEYWFFGTGWEQNQSLDEQPKKRMTVRCDGPDAGYIATAGCVLSCALTILKDRASMPKEG
jgi:hypothetical protein